MGTRGFIGFVIDGAERIAYNHYDSYPSGLGQDTLTWLRFAAADVDNLAALVRKLRVVDSESTPSAEDIEQLSSFADLTVAERSAADWYCLLRETQGNPAAILQAGVLADASGFPADSLFAEWGYIVDLDARELQVYQGFQLMPHDKGRFAKLAPLRDGDPLGNTYYPVALVKSWPLDALPSDDEMGAIGTDEDDE